MELDTFYTASTRPAHAPEPLKAGRYELVEMQAAPGYVLDGTPVPFTIDGKQQVVTVEKANIPQKGVILLEKTGEVFWSVEETGGLYQPVYRMQNLAGAVFELIADEDIYTPDGTLRAAKGHGGGYPCHHGRRREKQGVISGAVPTGGEAGAGGHGVEAHAPYSEAGIRRAGGSSDGGRHRPEQPTAAGAD